VRHFLQGTLLRGVFAGLFGDGIRPFVLTRAATEVYFFTARFCSMPRGDPRGELHTIRAQLSIVFHLSGPANFHDLQWIKRSVVLRLPRRSYHYSDVWHKNGVGIAG